MDNPHIRKKRNRGSLKVKMKNDDSGSDSDDLPLSSLGLKKTSSHATVHDDKKKKKSGNSESHSSPTIKIPKPDTNSASKIKETSHKNTAESKGKKSKKPSTPSSKGKPSPKKKGASKAKAQLKGKKKGSELKKKKVNKTSNADDPVSSSSRTIVTASSELYSRCDKGKLIQSVLCRWWYAYHWPDPSLILSSPPPHCDSLDGFPGVYVVTSGPNVGEIKDFRNHDKCPNFRNFSRMSSDELKTLLIEAIDKQKVALVNAEGSGTNTEDQLNELKKWASKINGPKADKEAEKILKTVNLC
jgi:hypothetical protein